VMRTHDDAMSEHIHTGSSASDDHERSTEHMVRSPEQ
jgi:hypothetical protein